MSLSREYRRQYAWRPWPAIFGALPPVRGRTVLDLGCGIGDQAAGLVAQGARVVGFDANERLLSVARARELPGAEFRQADLRAFPDPGVAADGLWSSFAAAYFPDLAAVLVDWAAVLRPGGWVALTEIDDLFGHHPVTAHTQEILEAYACEALRAGLYDFHAGRKLAGHLQQAGFVVTRQLTLRDRELSFDGPAPPAVVEAWRARFERMDRLREFCGPAFEAVRDDFLGCLRRADHVATARVCCCVATRRPGHHHP